MMASGGRLSRSHTMISPRLTRARLRRRLLGPGEIVGMRDGRLAFPGDLVRRLQAFQRRAECGRRRVDGERGMIDAAEFLGARMHMHQLHLRLGNVEQRVALRRTSRSAARRSAAPGRRPSRARAASDWARCRDRRRNRDAARRTNTAAKGGRHRQREALGKARQRGAGGFRPAAAADERDRALGRPQQLLQAAHVGQARPGFHRLERRSHPAP